MIKSIISIFILLNLFALIESNYFLHITDVHLDPEYYPGSPDNCFLGSTKGEILII